MSKEQIIYELPDLKGEIQFKFLLNARQSREGLELLTSLKENSVSLVFLDPQYEPVKNVLAVNYPFIFTLG